MDGGPFRVPRPADRGAVRRPEPAQPRQPEEPQPVVEEEPKPVHRATSSHRMPKEEKSWKRFLLPIIAAIVVIVLGAGGWFMWAGAQNGGTAIDSGKYQAVFFTNGQVYFGKLHAFNNDYLKLTDIYYLQSQGSGSDSKNPQKTSTDQSNVQLIKLGDEIHGPEDEMVIAKDQMLFYENLKSDGKVAQSIAKYKDSK